MYVARDEVLGLTGKVDPVVCNEYEFMNKYAFPLQYAQTSPSAALDSKLVLYKTLEGAGVGWA